LSLSPTTPAVTPEKPIEMLAGPVERVTFHNADNGFCVLQVKVQGREELVPVIGHCASVNPGEYIEAHGHWWNDREHGLQFKAKILRTIHPTTLEGIEKYLGSGLIKGIGPHFAAKLVKTFAEQVFDVIEQEPNRLLSVEGIGKGRLSKIVKGWKEQRVVREIMVFLQSHGVGTMRAVRIYKTYGEQAIEIVRENPYRLARDIRGIGFKTADQLAQRLGIDAHSPLRAQAGVNHVLLELSGEGHCAFPVESLVAEAVKLLVIPDTIIRDAIAQEIRNDELIQEEADGERWLYLKALYQSEVGLAKTLRQLSAGSHPLPEIDMEKAIAWVEQRTSLILAPSQREAITLAMKSKTLVITGGPGVGKTTLVKSILSILMAKKLECLLCAPTGRAAKRLFESTGLEAKTIHRLLTFQPENAQFKYNRDNRLKCDVLIVDECSMVDLPLMYKLLQSVPDNAAVILVGDVDQLPSVGPGQVLLDCIQAGTLPVVRLTEIFRQAAQSQIVTNAHRINQGHMIEATPSEAELSDFYLIEANDPEAIVERLLRLVRERIPRRFGFRSVEDIQVLTPMNRSGLGARALNVELQKALNPNWGMGIERYGSRFAPGDKVMQTENDYDKDVFNGDIGIIQNVDTVEQEVTVDFDGKPVTYGFDELDELSLAYACTIHKSQGSEYPVVIVVLHSQHYPMLRKNLIYTGITRGKRLVILLGSRKALWIALKHAGENQRFSRLRRRLM
jgi:exodeoxyribonuclease V alpha subunit